MRGWQPLDVTKAGRRVVVVQAKQQKIADRSIVELLGYFRMHSNAIQRVAEEEKIAKMRVVERPDAQMIPRAKKVFCSRIPNRKRKIAAQMLDAGCSPSRVRVQNQFRV